MVMAAMYSTLCTCPTAVLLCLSYLALRTGHKNNPIPKARNGREKDPYNTVVIYTMDGFLNEEQAGQCIINFFYNMTLQMKLSHCFCGDRVGILVQVEDVFDKPKDTKTGQELFYKNIRRS